MMIRVRHVKRRPCRRAVASELPHVSYKSAARVQGTAAAASLATPADVAWHGCKHATLPPHAHTPCLVVLLITMDTPVTTSLSLHAHTPCVVVLLITMDTPVTTSSRTNVNVQHGNMQLQRTQRCRSYLRRNAADDPGGGQLLWNAWSKLT